MRTDSKALREEIAAEVTRDQAFAGDDAAKLVAWDPFDPNAFAPFFDGEWMFGLDASGGEGWFDIAFANPPYIRQEKIEAFQINGRAVVSKAQLKADYKDTYVGTADIYVYFYERALRLLKPEGALAFITSNKWYRAGYGKGLRAWLSSNARILKIIDFGDAPVFEAIAYPTILIGTRRTAPDKPGPRDVIRSLNWTPSGGEDPKEAVKAFPERFAAEAFAMPQAELSASGWQLEPQAERQLLARIRAGGKPLGKRLNLRLYYGLKTGLTKAFIIDGVKRAEFIAKDSRSSKIIKPFLRGQDIKRWKIEHADKWLIKIASSENEKHAWSGLEKQKAEANFKENYPAVSDWLTEPNRKALLSQRSDQGHYYWELRSCSYYDAFESARIIYPDITLTSAFAYSEIIAYSADTTFIIPTTERWLVGVLNSSVINLFFRGLSPSIQGDFLRFKSIYVEQIPIPTTCGNQVKQIDILVGALQSGADRGHLEALINAFVFELFFPEDLHARNLRPFATAEAAGLMSLAAFEGPALARAANDWSRQLADPSTPLYATLFDLQSLDMVRIIEGRG